MTVATQNDQDLSYMDRAIQIARVGASTPGAAPIGCIVHGAGRGDVHRMYFEDRHLDTFDFIADAFRDDLRLTGGVRAAECAQLYYGPDDNPPGEKQGNV